MEPALDVIGRALQGDPGSNSFLDRTSSIYVLDATDPSKPKTYGCWNFIHQAMNEVERYEASFARSHQIHVLQNGAGLGNHVKLLATMALRVSRRSPDVDRSLVSTCVVNAGSQFNGTPEQSQWLIDLNLELREIVMGRIAAMAFDFSFHRKDGPHGHSAFADPTVMELFCAVLASNAVSSGPLAVRHFVTEWIVPSTNTGTLPPFAVACVTLHLALGALRKAAPAGTKDMMQQLSFSIVAAVLAPVLLDAVGEDSSMNTTSGGSGSDAASQHEKNNQVAAICIRALERWCAATDLSLAQIKHICSKVEVNFIEVINDAMYSDSKHVVEALAEFIEASVSDNKDIPTVLEERMTQVRYLLQVDEVAFQSNFSADQLNLIESKEMSSIVDELVSAIGLQRFRFTERQNNGDHDVCRSLVRIASALCSAAINFSADHGHPLKNEPGLVDLMMKGAAHPSVNISGISLAVLAHVVRLEQSLGPQLLPLLQRRAITPHHIVSGAPYLAASDICGVNFHEFEIFRDTVLTDALRACFEDNSANYMDSCTSAVEEFCSENSSSQVSLHLEAALFCLSVVSDLALGTGEGQVFAHHSQLERCTSALATKPESLMANPLTLAQMCRFLRRYTRWYGESSVQGVLDVGTDLALSTFNLCAASYPGGEASRLMMQESSVSPGKEAALTLREILCQHPKYFVSNSAITALGAGWEASYAACNRTDAISIDDRKALCVAICHVLAALPDNQRVRSFHALALPALDCFEKMTSIANNTNAADKGEIDEVLRRVADEIEIFTVMARTFTNACFANDSSTESGCSTASVRNVAIPVPLLVIIRKVWPSIVHVAAMYSNNKRVAEALGKFLVEFLPPECNNKGSFSLLKELCSVALSILKMKGVESQAKFQPVFGFLTEFVNVHGEAAESRTQDAMKGLTVPETKDELSAVLTDLLLAAVDELQSSSAAPSVGNEKEQGQGQPAYESKSQPAPKGVIHPGDEFCGMLELFRACLERCPSYFFQLPSAPGLVGREDMLSRKAADLAVGFLNEFDVATAQHAMQFLEFLIKLTQSQNNYVREHARETISTVQQNIIAMLLLGSCGKLSFAALGDAAHLICSVLTVLPPTEEIRTSAINALAHEQFRLGDDARHVFMGTLEGVARHEVTAAALTNVLEQNWELHQLDEVESLEASDVVTRFVKRFSR